MQNKHVQSSDSLRVCQWRSWYNERQGHLTHNHITTCAFSSILLLSIIPCECNALFMDVLCTAFYTSPHMFHWICPWFWIVKFIPLFYKFGPKLIDNFQRYQSFPCYCAEPRKESSKQNLDFLKLLSVSAAAGLLVAFRIKLFNLFF